MQVRTTNVGDADERAEEAERADHCWNLAVLRRLVGDQIRDVWLAMMSSWRGVGMTEPRAYTVDDVLAEGRDAAFMAYLPPMVVMFGSSGSLVSPDAVRRLADCSPGEAVAAQRAMVFAAGGFGEADDPHMFASNGWPPRETLLELLRTLADGIVAEAARRPLPHYIAAGLDDYHVRAEASSLIVSAPLIRAMPASIDAPGFLSLAAYAVVRPEKIVLTRKK